MKAFQKTILLLHNILFKGNNIPSLFPKINIYPQEVSTTLNYHQAPCSSSLCQVYVTIKSYMKLKMKGHCLHLAAPNYVQDFFTCPLPTKKHQEVRKSEISGQASTI